MPLVAAKCTNCGAGLTVDSSQQAAVCEHCDMPYIVEKAINNYSMTININDGSLTSEALMERANIYLNDGDFIKADEYYEMVLERSPQNHRAHWGKLLATLGFSNDSVDELKKMSPKNCSRLPFYLSDSHYNNAVKFAPEKVKQRYAAWYDTLKKLMLLEGAINSTKGFIANYIAIMFFLIIAVGLSIFLLSIAVREDAWSIAFVFILVGCVFLAGGIFAIVGMTSSRKKRLKEIDEIKLNIKESMDKIDELNNEIDNI